MSGIRYQKIDAFTSGQSMGNPASCLILNQLKLTDAQMLAVGKEQAGFVSEVVFVNDSNVADCKLTYYSSECEVDFCGHGTIATMYQLIKQTPELLDKKEIMVETNKKGILVVYNQIQQEDSIYITAPESVDLDMPVSSAEIAAALGISEDLIDHRYPIDHIEAGLKTLIVPIRKLSDEISIWPDEQKLKEFVLSHHMENVLIFSKETQDAAKIAHTRVFAPKFGYLEDPATGSSNSAFANYLIKYDMWDGKAAALEQGGNNRIYNTVKIRQKDGRILFGGSATLRIDGEYFLGIG